LSQAATLSAQGAPAAESEAQLAMPVTSAVEKPQEGVLRVRALVGGSSVFVFSADQIQWINRSGSRPGRDADGTQHAIVVNGEEWTPSWIGFLSTRHSVPFGLPDPAAETEVWAVLKGRGRMETRKTDAAIAVRLDDTAAAGAGRYDFELHVGRWDGEGQPEAAGAQLVPFLPRETDAGVAQDTAESRGLRVDMLADRAARGVARQALGDRFAAMEEAWQRIGPAEANATELGLQIEEAKRDFQHWSQQFREAEQEVTAWEQTDKLSVAAGSSAARWERTYKALIATMDARRRARDAAMKGQAQLQQELAAARGELELATYSYERLKSDYDAEFTRVYEEEFQSRRQTLADDAERLQEERAKAVRATLGDRPVAGRYVLVHRGDELGTVTLFSDGSLTTLVGERRPDYHWHVTDEGLVIRLRDIEWLFTPAPMDTLLGRCTGPYPELVGLRALLRRVTD
jgi:hypothetical protein